MRKKLLGIVLSAALVLGSVNITTLAAETAPQETEEAASIVLETVEEEQEELTAGDAREGDEQAEERENVGLETEETIVQTTKEQSDEETVTQSAQENLRDDTERTEGSEIAFSLEDASEIIVVEGELEGVYQFGDAPSERKAAAFSMRAAEDEAAAGEYIYQEILKRNTTIDISKYNLSWESASTIVQGLLNDFPELYFVGNRIGGSTSGSSGNCISINLTYDNTLDDNAFRKGVKAALSVVKPGMSDLEKAIVLHDYLAVNCEYDKERLDAGASNVPSTSFSAYGVFVNQIAVCQGYALAYKYLLNQVGIECYMVDSASMNHAWNLIVLNGEYYQVDVTWDDPTWDLVGRAVHTYMFCSDSGFAKHSDWKVTKGGNVVDYRATSTKYDNAFWKDCDSPLVLSGESCYYTAYDRTERMAKIKKTSLDDITAAGEVICNIGNWNGWQGAFSGLFCVNNRLYYNDTTSIYSIALDGTDKKTEFPADTSEGYIYGSALRQGKVYYSLHQTPNLTEKETVLVADIQIPVEKPDDEGSSSAEEGSKPEGDSKPEESSSAEEGSKPEGDSKPEESSSAEESSKQEESSNASESSSAETTETDSSEPESDPESGDIGGSESTAANDIQIVGLADSYPYTGDKITPAFDVYDYNAPAEKQLLSPGIDYTVTYKNNVKATEESGSPAKIIVKGKGNYAATKTAEASFEIKKESSVAEFANIKGAKIDKIEDADYTGNPYNPPEIKLIWKGKEPKTVAYQYNKDKGTYEKTGGSLDVYIAVSNNVNKGTASVLVSGVDDKGKEVKLKAKFKIKPLNLDDGKTTIEPETLVADYLPNGAVPKFTVKYNGTELKQGRDYTVKYSNNKKVSDKPAVLTVTGKGNYARKVIGEYKINQADMAKFKVSAVTACDGIKKKQIKATVDDGKGNVLKTNQYHLIVYPVKEDGTLGEPYKDTDQLEAGKRIYVKAVTVDDKNLKPNSETQPEEFTVGIDISKAKFPLAPDYKKGIAYTGTEIRLASKHFDNENVTIQIKKDGQTKVEKLVMGRDYKIVSYSNNIDKGTATAVIKGVGDYSGTKIIKFKIKQQAIKSVKRQKARNSILEHLLKL